MLKHFTHLLYLENQSSGSLECCQSFCLYTFRALEFMDLLDHMYEAQNMDLGDITVSRDTQVNVLKLRAILDNLVEQMPPLLEIGNVPRVR